MVFWDLVSYVVFGVRDVVFGAWCCVAWDMHVSKVIWDVGWQYSGLV